MSSLIMNEPLIARINGVALHTSDEILTADDMRQRAYSELLRQAAQRQGLLGVDDVASGDGIPSAEASGAIEALLEQSIQVAEPSEEVCRRHYDAQRRLYSTGERIRARHILFAVTHGVDVVALRNRAETTLLEVRCHDGSQHDAFATVARQLSNCPSAALGGDLGWLSHADCAPEFAKELFGQHDVGVLPRLVHSRFGLHVVEVLERKPGVEQPFEAVRGAVAMSLKQKAYVTALRQYLKMLAGQASLQGLELESAQTPLVQ